MRISVFFLALVGLGYSFAAQCGEPECPHRDLKSFGAKEIIPIEGAASIISMSYEGPPSDAADSRDHKCGGNVRADDADEEFYGIDVISTGVFVQHGCQGRFKICYIPGVCETYILSPKRPNITLHQSCAIQSMECIRRHTEHPCVMDQDFTFYNNFAKVNNSANACDCAFRICHSVKQEDEPEPEPAAAPVNNAKPAKSMAGGFKDLNEYNAENSESNYVVDNSADPSDMHEHV